MPNIRFRNPNGDALDFVDVIDRPEVRRALENRGWIVAEDQPQEGEPPRAGLVEAIREQQEIQARRAIPPVPPPMPREWPGNEVWENFGVGARFFWAGEEFEVIRDPNDDLDIQRVLRVEPARVWPPQPRGQDVVEALNVANELLRRAQWRIAPPVRAGDELVSFGAGTNRKKGEELFRLILSGIKEIYDVDAVIAGGAVRDLVVGDTEGSKDVDVFIPMKWEDFNKNSDELGWQGKPGLLHKKPYKTVVAKTSSARASAVVQGMPVDLVFMDGGLTPEGVDGFPVNAQKCVWNLAEGLVVSPAAKADIEGKKFTISPAITDKQVIADLSLKISGWMKRPCYKGWKLITPKIKEWWQKQNDPHTVERGKKEKKTKANVWDNWKDEDWLNAVVDPFGRVVNGR